MQTNSDLQITPTKNGFIVRDLNPERNAVMTLNSSMVFNTLEQLTEFLESHFSEIARQENYR